MPVEQAVIRSDNLTVEMIRLRRINDTDSSTATEGPILQLAFDGHLGDYGNVSRVHNLI
jgi:hypothetical protein